MPTRGGPVRWSDRPAHMRFPISFEVQREQREENEVSMKEMSVMNEQESWNAYVQKLSNVQKILRAKRF